MANSESARPEAPQSRFYSMHEYRRQLRASGIYNQLSPSAAIVIMALADFADADGYCWPSVKRIADENPVSDRSVQRAIRELEERGLLVRQERPNQSNMYKLALGLPAKVRQIGTPAKVSPTPRHDDTRGVTLCHPNKAKNKTVNRSASKDAAAPVSSSSVSSPGELPDDVKAIARNRRGISVATLHRLMREYGADAVRQAIAVVSKKHPTDATIKTGFGAVLTTALRDGWASEAELPAPPPPEPKADPSEPAAPPPSWAKWFIFNNQLFELVDVSSGFISGRRPVGANGWETRPILEDHWHHCEWFAEQPVPTGRTHRWLMELRRDAYKHFDDSAWVDFIIKQIIGADEEQALKIRGDWKLVEVYAEADRRRWASYDEKGR